MKVAWRPHPKQVEALERTEYEILYGWARGWGKTDAGMAFLLYDSANPKYRALVIRRNAVDLTDWIDRAREFYRWFKVEVVWGNEIRFPSWAIIRLWHLKDENAYNRYQGHEYQKMLIEELTHIPTEDLYLKLISSCRSTVPGIQPQVFCTTNPWEIWHARVKRRFIDVALPWVVYHDPISDRSRIFIPSRIEDNPTLMINDPTYIKFLEALPPDLMKAWREGSRDVFDTKGSFYSAYIMQVRKDNRICKWLREQWLPIYKFRDLWIDDEMVIICAQFMGKEVRIIDCLYGNNEGLAYYIDLLREKWYWIDNCYFPHDVRVREQSSWGKTREDYLKSLWVDVHIVSNISIEDWISQVRMIFNKIWFEDNPWVQKLIEALNIYRKKRDEKNLVFWKPIHDWSSNFADAMRYLSVAYSEIVLVKSNDFRRNTQRTITNPITWQIMNKVDHRADFFKKMGIKI